MSFLIETRGRPSKDLTPYKNEISNLFNDSETAEAIVDYLLAEYRIKVTSRTIQRRLRTWGFRRRIKTQHHEDLENQILNLFYQCGLSDTDMHYVLQKQGLQIGLDGLRRYRRRMGLLRRFKAGEVEDEIRIAVQKELDSGQIEGYVCGLLYTYFRSRQHIVSRPRNELQRTRGDFSVPGPNFPWSIDRHAKLFYWGVQIYTGIDAYSHYITWIYVGTSNRKEFSVLRQFLDTLQSEKKQPRFVRSHKGGEATLLAAAHHALYKKHYSDSNISDCYWYGTSTSNQRIEAWWSQMPKSVLFRWRDYFQRLVEDRLFAHNNAAGRIAILAVYMPLFRQEICNYVRIWNVHRIRSIWETVFALSFPKTRCARLWVDP
ncbi:hypothetical protein TSTA_085080 [Talaromyces stipitatus ATCC 10500]|uniref:Uncharacterized protein n=1 Tax=Talaromyces stipitatus (strain ATCC 10500 / CBS 375.48 / QM 6759 / NRRL 1006) TaxID=441959 RepID=B8M0I0_TALSN|nr:uncharacterized protein TSTA_085080 [Talaromyces stipitatus ATCC 10500]EED21277.1 hypothetical protein TSTA_085080 [Talaromyces stipitatus ATCC 10500]